MNSTNTITQEDIAFLLRALAKEKTKTSDPEILARIETIETKLKSRTVL